LAGHFDVPAAVCINKWDLNSELSDAIEAVARKQGLAIAGRIRYDHAVTEAQIHGQTIVEYLTDGCAEDTRRVWEKLLPRLADVTPPSDTRQRAEDAPSRAKPKR